MPGRVKANPPATIAPELIIVCVTLISCKEDPLNRLKRAMLTTVTNTVGHGNAPMRNATYMELLVMMIRPINPMMNPRIVISCMVFSSMARSPSRVMANYSRLTKVR